jgi:hypothetical protein
LITGEFVIGEKDEKKKVVNNPYITDFIPPSNYILMAYNKRLSRKNKPIPFHCILQEYEPNKEIENKYLEMKSGLSLPKKNLIDIATKKNLN